MMKRQIATTAMAALLGLSVAMPAFAGVIEDRQANFKANNLAMRTIGAAIGANDVDTIKAQANKIAEWAKVMPDYFPEGSNSPSVKDDLWANFDLFVSQANDNHKAALALIEVADSNDQDKIVGALRAVGATCKACHQNFKGY